MSKSSSRARSTIIWAIDPFAITLPQLKSTAAMIDAWRTGTRLSVQPVSIVNPPVLSWPPRIGDVPWEDRFKLLSRERMHKSLDMIEFEDTEEPRIILQSLRSRTGAVRSLLKEARARGASLIVTATHSRKKPQKLFTGSFTEALVSLSPLPVLTVKPGYMPRGPIRRILLPTDFSLAARQLFDQVLTHAHRLKAQIVLFHQIEVPVDMTLSPLSLAGGGAWAPLEPLLAAAEAEQKNEAKKWVRLAAKRGVRAKSLMTRGGLNLAEEVVKSAEGNRIDIIAVATEASRTRAAVIGSVARQVIRLSDIPVMILHT